MSMNKLYIGNLPADVNEGSLRELFHEHTGIPPKTVLVKKGGYAFVECNDQPAADKAIETLNGFDFMGSNLLVEPSVPQGRRDTQYYGHPLRPTQQQPQQHQQLPPQMAPHQHQQQHHHHHQPPSHQHPAAAAALRGEHQHHQQHQPHHHHHHQHQQQVHQHHHLHHDPYAIPSASSVPHQPQPYIDPYYHHERARLFRSRTNKVQVSNIPNHVQWDEVKRLLSTFGNVQQCDQGPSKVESSYCVLVIYETQDQAQQAFAQLNGYEFEGSPLKVDFVMEQPGRSQQRGARGGRGGGQGGSNNFRGGNFPYSGNQSNLRPTDFPLSEKAGNSLSYRILVLSDMVGAIIGRSGGTIRQITQQSRARVDVHRKENAGSLEKVITIYGNPENCSSACQKILEVMQQEADNTNRGEIPLKILAHNNLIGRIIGKNGNTIKRIMEQTDTKITVSSSIHDVNSFNLERIITIKGKLENICKAEQMISAKLRQSYENDLAVMAPQALMFPGLHPIAMMSTLGAQGYPPPRGGPTQAPPFGMYTNPPSYMPMMYPPSSVSPQQQQQPPQAQQEPSKESVFLYIPNSAVGAIIGTGGSTIRDMISSSGASIKVAQPNKDEPLDRQAERKVTIVGSPESQWKAQFMIFKKVSYEGFAGPQEARLRVEIFVPSNQVGRIIGKGGQTVRELQRMTHAIIKLPEESQNTSAEETPVHIIGDFYSTQAAQRQIRALVNRNQPVAPRGPSRRGPPQQQQQQTQQVPPQIQQQQQQQQQQPPPPPPPAPQQMPPQQPTPNQTTQRPSQPGN